MNKDIDSLEELQKIIKQKKLTKIYLINTIGNFDTYSLNIGTKSTNITYVDWRGPEILFQSTDLKSVIKKYIEIIISTTALPE